jgi:hypothetical protein
MFNVAFVKTMLFLTIYAIGVLTTMFMLRKTIVKISTREIEKELKNLH